MKFFGEQAGLNCLNRGWKFSSKNLSVLPQGKNHDDVYSYAKAGSAKGPAELGYDDSDWQSVTIPHDWVTENEFSQSELPNQGYKKRGTGWYRVQFELKEEDKGNQILLEFEGLSCDAEIYVNGSLLKYNFSGYNSFSVDMTDMANFGVVPNVLAVKIDASAWEGWWYEGAGIYRNVWLIKKPPIHIAYNGTYAKPKFKHDKWNLELQVEVENSFEFERDFVLRAELSDKAGNLLAVKEQKGKISPYSTTNEVIYVNDLYPKRWSPDSPELYEITYTVISENQIDFYTQNIGFREIEIDAKTGFWLNGENIKLKGFCNHQDHAGVGVAVPYAVKEYRVKLLKELGANAYRCAHNPDPEILDICDKLGLMVMEENRMFSTSEENLRGLEGVVKTARNHPSVIMYSIFNEEPLQGTQKGHRLAGRMRQCIRNLDDTRPVLGALNGGYMEEDGSTTSLDIVGINYNPKIYDEFHKKFPDIPLVGSETASAYMVRGEHTTDYEKNTISNYDEDCAAWGNTIRETWKSVNERKFVMGSFVWTGFDYRGEPTPFTWPSVSTFFGTYDSCGFEKDGCYLYKAFWKPEPIIHSISPWNTKLEKGQKVKILAVTNCDEVAVYIGEKQVDRKKSDKYDQVIFELPYENKPLVLKGISDGLTLCEDIQPVYKPAQKLKLEISKTTMNADYHDAVIVNVFAVDEDDNVVPDADHLVNMEVYGGGEIIGVGNGNPNSHEPDVAPYRKLFHGRCQMIIKNTDKDNVKVQVSTTELSGAEVEINVKEIDYIPYVKTVNEKIIENWRLYYKLFDEIPDVNLKVEKNDMNSFESVSFNGGPQPQFVDNFGKYGLYRSTLKLDAEEYGRFLYFAEVFGHVRVYVDSQLMGTREDAFTGPFAIEIPTEWKGNYELTVIVHNSNKDWPQAGICMPPVIMK